ncbi:putative ribonuclease H-like domain-containing protein [Tanacetum coccineum]
MGYHTDSDKLTFQNGAFSPQWRFLIHNILHCLSPKKTAWEQFSSNIATAVICLATNRKYNFSRMIFEHMVSNISSPHKFFMYPRFIQICLDMQRKQLQQHSRTYPVPSLSIKVFNNMKRPTKGYSGQEVDLFPTMLDVSEPSTSPSRITSSPSHSPEPLPSHAPSFEHSPDHTTAAPTQPSPTQPSLTQPSTEAEHHFPTPHDSPLHTVHSHGSDEGSLKLNELTNLVTKLSEMIEVLEDDMRKIKKTYSSAFTKLILRVNKLEARVKIGKARKRAKVVLSEDDKDVEDDSSKHGRKLSDAEVQEKASTKIEPFIQEVTPIEVIQDQGSSEKGSTEVSTAGATKGTASEVPVVSTAEENISTAGRIVTYRRRNEEQRTRKDKGKAIMTESEPKKKSKKELEQEKLSFAEAIRLQEQMDEEQRAQIARDKEITRQWDEEERQRAMSEVKSTKKIDWNDPSVIRYHALKMKPKTIAQARRNMIKYLKNQGNYKISDFKGMSYNEIRPIFEKVWDFNQHIEPMEHGNERMKSPKKIEKEDIDTQKEVKEVAKESGAKRKKSLPRKRSDVKRQKMEIDDEKEDLKVYLDIVPRDDATEDVESLSIKYPIVDWKTCVLTENFMYYQVFRGDGSSKNYKVLSEMLEDFDRQDVEELYRLVKEKYSASRLEGFDLMLWGDLYTLFESDEEDEIWKNQHEYNLISWRLCDFCGIHILLMENGLAIHMLTEKKYPLSQEMLSKMLSRKLEVDHESSQAFELLRFIRSQGELDSEDIAAKQALKDDLERMVAQEMTAQDVDDATRQAFEEEKRKSASTKRAAQATSINKLNTGRPSVNTANTPYVSAASTPTGANAGESSFVYLRGQIPIDASTLPNVDLPTDPNMHDLEDVSNAFPNDGIFSGAYDDDDVDTETNFNNMDHTIDVSPIPTLRIHKVHPKDQILGDPKSAVQTRGKIQKASSVQQALVSYIYNQNRTNHKDHQNCLLACFLSQVEPKTISQALEDESWVEAMQEELLQFKLHKVWILVDLPFGKKAIGTKWVFGNKRDERSIVVKNKSRLVAQGFRQEEGIDYDEVFAPVARIKAIRLFLAFASFMGFPVYQMDVKSAFLYGTIGEEIYDKYVADILKKFDFCSIRTTTTLIESNKPLVQDEDGMDVDVHVYRSMIGSLMYLTASRPDIMFAVYACARFQVTPKASHLNAVKRIFSDYRGASLNRKSTTGGCQFLGRRLISWQCKKQTIVANSTTKAKYVAAANCCGKVLWIQNQMMDYGFNFMHTKIHIDNESTICIVKNPVYHSRTKHIEIRHHFIRDCYEKRLIDIFKIHTDNNVADLLTKGFDVTRFNFLVVSIGMLNL